MMIDMAKKYLKKYLKNKKIAKSAFWAKMALPPIKMLSRRPLGGFLEPLSKPGK